MSGLPAILVVDRFAPLTTHLLALLAELRDDEWTRPTAAPHWSVKDVAAHLLGGDVGILSRERDRFHASVTRVETYTQLVTLINELNEEWVRAAKRISPRLLCEMLEFFAPRVERYFASLDMHALGGPVSWAGPDPAPVWFDVAREFTERWHHQQQIRDATGRSPLYDPYLFAPVLDTFVRVLPHTFRSAVVPTGTTVRFEISGEAGGVWFLCRHGSGWTLDAEPLDTPATHVTVPQDTAWRVFTKGIERGRARELATVDGDERLAALALAATSIIG
jgi:uncharacterized protein (TIGR03083 family)